MCHFSPIRPTKTTIRTVTDKIGKIKKTWFSIADLCDILDLEVNLNYQQFPEHVSVKEFFHPILGAQNIVCVDANFAMNLIVNSDKPAELQLMLTKALFHECGNIICLPILQKNQEEKNTPFERHGA